LKRREPGGEVELSTAAGDSVFSSPAVADGVVYVGTFSEHGDGPGAMYALKASDGSLLWKHSMGSTFSSAAVANTTVYMGSDDGNLYAFALP
jgi:eukaryotic-like serine/threonine-protein kinase